MLKRLSKNKVIFFVEFILLILGLTLILISRKESLRQKLSTDTGKEVVKYLYNFTDVKQLDSQMVLLKQSVTEPVFNQLTIDNEERTLNTYLKFKNTKCFVKFIKCTPDYIMYSLENENIAKDRVFCFYYHVNNKGKIDTCKEVETIAFIKSSN